MAPVSPKLLVEGAQGWGDKVDPAQAGMVWGEQERDEMETAVTFALKSLEEGHIWE